MSDCAHVHTDYQAAEPDVGIMHEYLGCEDCGADLTDTVLVQRRDAAAEARAERQWELKREGNE